MICALHGRIDIIQPPVHPSCARPVPNIAVSIASTRINLVTLFDGLDVDVTNPWEEGGYGIMRRTTDTATRGPHP